METKYKILKKGKKGRETGECFLAQLGDEAVVLGLVACDDTKWANNVSGLPTVLFYKTSCGRAEAFNTVDIVSTITSVENLLAPPVITNDLGWTKGYFKQIDKVDITKCGYISE